MLYGEAYNGLLHFEQYQGKGVHQMKVQYDVNEPTAGKASGLVQKGKGAVFYGTVWQGEPLTFRVFEIQLTTQVGGPPSPNSKELLPQKSNSPLTRSGKRKITFSFVGDDEPKVKKEDG